MLSSKPRFLLGQTVATPGALEALKVAHVDPSALLTRHVSGDWGDLDEQDKQENEFSVGNNLRIMSSYALPQTGAKVWVITEANRSSTTLLLPSE